MTRKPPRGGSDHLLLLGNELRSQDFLQGANHTTVEDDLRFDGALLDISFGKLHVVDDCQSTARMEESHRNWDNAVALQNFKVGAQNIAVGIYPIVACWIIRERESYDKWDSMQCVNAEGCFSTTYQPRKQG
jgi:hypothetical protein